jgi:L-serine dehydratase
MMPPQPACVTAKANATQQSGVEAISVFDIFKIGVGPSSSHTMGPWRATQRFLKAVDERVGLAKVERVRVDLFGSLAKTGKGHGTDLAVVLALAGEDPVTCKVAGLTDRFHAALQRKRLRLAGEHEILFDAATDLSFHMDRALPFHPNGVTFTAFLRPHNHWDRPPAGLPAGSATSIPSSTNASLPQAVLTGGLGSITETYYSVGGGFVVQENESPSGHRAVTLPFPIERAAELLTYCENNRSTIPQIVLHNELAWRGESDIRIDLLKIWREMHACIWRGCTTDGILPGGLNVMRRAAGMSRKMLEGDAPAGIDAWTSAVKASVRDFEHILKWVSAFALAVNEENACFGRVVTAPTNGAAGVIPAVMMYARCFKDMNDDKTIAFMLASGEIGSLFKKGATISAAMGGCQAEIGVSSAMAAAGLTQVLGGTPGQVLMAAEIAMEHHLGMTCDPIGGLVQIPCIERNIMGAIKAITAANVAMESNPATAKVSLDQVIATMWQTAKDMSTKYKETAEGGLAVAVTISEC